MGLLNSVFSKMLPPTRVFDQDPSTEAAGPQQRNGILRPARNHYTSIEMLFEVLHYMTELRTWADHSPGLRGPNTPLVAQPLSSTKDPWKKTSFTEM